MHLSQYQRHGKRQKWGKFKIQEQSDKAISDSLGGLPVWGTLPPGSVNDPLHCINLQYISGGTSVVVIKSGTTATVPNVRQAHPKLGAGRPDLWNGMGRRVDWMGSRLLWH